MDFNIISIFVSLVILLVALSFLFTIRNSLLMYWREGFAQSGGDCGCSA